MRPGSVADPYMGSPASSLAITLSCGVVTPKNTGTPPRKTASGAAKRSAFARNTRLRRAVSRLERSGSLTEPHPAVGSGCAPSPVRRRRFSRARRAALAHAVYAPEVRHPVEVAAVEKAHLAAWLSKRLEAEVRAPDLGGAGFALLGGRLLPGEALSGAASLPAAQFM